MLGYVDDSAGPMAPSIWFRTGDIGYCNDDKWYIIDRAKVRAQSPTRSALTVRVRI